MFASLAPSYDRLNGLLTFGLVHTWRRELVRAAGLEPSHRVIDVCTGTGKVLAEVDRVVGPGGMAVGVDFTPEMLHRAVGRRVLADGLRLPFEDDTFDAAVSAFALRDVADQHLLVVEMVRVTRPGGRVAILEIGRPRGRLARTGFDVWFRGAVPRVAALFGQGESHRFLVRSLDYLPAAPLLARLLEDAGAWGVGWRDLTLGAARLHVGRVPGRS